MSELHDEVTTYHVNPPIPIRNWDWCAYFNEQEEGLVGWGKTEYDAIYDLLERYYDFYEV